MASGIPTRRPTRRADENAPPTASISTRSRGATTNPTSTRTNSTSSLPVLKRQITSNIPPSTSNPNLQNIPNKPDAGITQKRSALGEVTNASKNSTKGAGATGKPAKPERAPLISTKSSQQVTQTITGRRTRASLAAQAEAPAEAAKEDRLAVKKKALATKVPMTKRTGVPSTTSASTSASVASTSTSVSIPLRPSKTQPSRKSQPKEHIHPEVENEPAAKRRRTSTPPPLHDDDDGLGDEANYDQDGKEIVLSSGGRGVSLKSPKRKLKRAKDEGWTDLDAEDEGDPTMVSEYVIDAFNYMFEIEVQTMASPNYMDNQAEIKWKMREVLMDWIIEIHSKFRLLPETLFIATNLIDRFLSRRVVSLVKLQLVGLTALFIAAKYEEVICPSVTHFLQMTDGGYDVDEVLRAERYVLSTLDFDLSYPNPLHFLRRISKADGYDIQTRTVAKYLIELSCIEHRLIPFAPSLLAAAAMWLARFCLEREEWSPNLVHYSNYSEEELLPAAQVMLSHILSPEFSTVTAFYKKYAAKKFMKTSVYVRDWAISRWPESAEGKGKYLGDELRAEVEGLI